MIELIKYILTNEVDKIAHITLAYGIALTVFLFNKKILKAVIIAFVFGLIKEIGDIFYNEFCVYDLSANIIGIVIAFFVIIYYILHRR